MLETLIPAVVGAVIALVGVTLTNRSSTQRLQYQLQHEREVKEREFHREKLEELYLLTEHWLHNLFSYYDCHESVMKGELTFDTAVEMDIEREMKDPVDFRRLNMIIDLYLPELRPEWDRIIEARDQASGILLEYNERCRMGVTDSSQFLEPFRLVQRQVAEEATTFKARIPEMARRDV